MQSCLCMLSRRLMERIWPCMHAPGSLPSHSSTLFFLERYFAHGKRLTSSFLVTLCFKVSKFYPFMAVGRSHAERTFSLWCYRLWNQGLFCFCFCLPMHTYMDGMISDFDVFCGEWWFCCRWFLVNMVSLPSLTRVVTSRRGQLSSELIRSFNPLMKTNSTLPKLGKKRSSSNLKLARMDKSSSFQMLQLMLTILPALLPSMYRH